MIGCCCARAPRDDRGSLTGGGVRGPPPYNLPAAHLQKIKITKFRCEYLASRTPPPHPIAPPPHHPDCSGRSSFHCRRGGTQKNERKKERGVKNPRWLLRLVDGPLLRSFSFSSPFSFSSTSSRFFIIIFFFSWRRVLVFQAGRAHSSAATGCGWRHRLHFLFEAPRFRIYRMLEETTTTTTTATTTQVVGKDGSPRPPISALYHAK